MAIDFEAGNTDNFLLSASISTFQNVSGATLMCWYLGESLANTEDYIVHFSTTNNIQSRCGIGRRSGLFRASARRLDGDLVTNLDGATSPSNGVLYHLAVTYNFTGQSLILYVNGAQDGSAAPSSWTGNTSNTAGTGRIGTRADGSATNDMDGVLEDVRAYNRALSAEEVNTIYQARGRDKIVNGLLHRYKMIEGSPGSAASTIVDIGSLKIDGSASGTPAYVTSLIANRHRRG
jgi:hypothetical protein